MKAAIVLTFFVILVLFSYRSFSLKGFIEENKPTSTPHSGFNLNTQSPKPTNSPTPKPLTFDEMNKLFGPCINAPVITYHHIQEESIAKVNKYLSLNVTPEMFEKHLIYLREKGYTSITLQEIINFFDNGKPVSEKPIIITFDDGYLDFYEHAYPLLKKYSFKGVLFLPTGLVNNGGYVNWQQVNEMRDSGYVYFGNHTWSHKSAVLGKNEIKEEIMLADMQLTEKGLNSDKVFAYPYGEKSQEAIGALTELNYSLGFTTKSGRILCNKQRLYLPRVRVGEKPLNVFGL